MEHINAIATNEDFSKYTELAKVVISRVLKKDKEGVTFFDIVTIAMGIVEHIKSEKKLSGQEKKNIAKSIIPVIIDILVELGKIKSDQSENLKKDIAEKTEIIEQFIDTASFLTNNPELINSGKWILKEGQEIINVCFKGKCAII